MGSRIWVKDLPKYVNEDRLKEFFSQKGELTDAKLMRTREGKSRQFAFIGYRTEKEAKEAIKYFNKSFLDTNKITCELAWKIGSTNVPRPWSQYSKEKQEKGAKKRKKFSSGEAKSEKEHLNKSNRNDDPKLQEFFQVMQPRSKSKLWADDVVVRSLDQNGKGTNMLDSSKQKVSKKYHKAEISKRPIDMDDGKDVSVRDLVQDKIVSDVNYFKSRVKKEWSDSESDSDEDGVDLNMNDEDNAYSFQFNGDKEDVQEKMSSEEQKFAVVDSEEAGWELSNCVSTSYKPEDINEVLQTGRLFVRSLPYGATEDELMELFSNFGNVSEVHLVIDKETKRSKGYGFVLYKVPEHAIRALEELDYSIFQGRVLHVLPAPANNSLKSQETHVIEGKSKTFKEQRVEQKKASEDSGNTRAWNSLFMRSDSIVENIARKFGINKGEFLDRDADDLAVRIALGETQIIAETKKALANAGVNVASLEELASGNSKGVKRSNHILLVKNFPYSSMESELSNMFGKFGSIDKIILPPTKTLALVIFLEPSEARAANIGLRYKRYKDAPLYLEWAPSNILERDTNTMSDMIVEGIIEAEIDPDRVESQSLYVKNLNFKTSDENLWKHVSDNMKEGKILSVRIIKHLKNGKNVSRGFGFIEFDSVETATNVCRGLQGTVLDGHALTLQLIRAKKDEKVMNKAGNKHSSTKLIVKDVAFEATKKDLRQLFSPFGQIKVLRLPKRLRKHRGFAFIEFVTKQEAQNALSALSNTHLYGRRLVLERAKEGETLEELRARTAAQFAGEEPQTTSGISRKRKRTIAE